MPSSTCLLVFSSQIGIPDPIRKAAIWNIGTCKVRITVPRTCRACDLCNMHANGGLQDGCYSCADADYCMLTAGVWLQISAAGCILALYTQNMFLHKHLFSNHAQALRSELLLAGIALKSGWWGDDNTKPSISPSSCLLGSVLIARAVL
eukprot:6192824-Pleurochrysis_carterae.AAC.5